MGILDFLKEIPASTQKVIKYLSSSVGNYLNETQNRVGETLKKQVQSIPKQDPTGINIIKSVIQGTAQSGGSVGLTLSGKKELTTQELQDANPILAKAKNIIFGPDPIKSLQTRIAETKQTLEKGVNIPLVGNVKAPQGTSGPLATIGVLGMVGLDFTGWGGGEKQAIKLLAKTSKVEEVAKILKTMKVADEAIPEASKIISGLSKEEDIVKVLKGIEETQKATKTAVEAQKGIAPALKTESKVLPQEAGNIIKTTENVIQDTTKVVEVAKPVERQFLQSVREARPDIPLKVGGQYVPRSTDNLAIMAKNLIKTDIITAEKLARTGTDEKAVATAAELIKHYSDEAIKAPSAAVKNALYEKASDVAHITASNLTEQGRAVQAASIMGRLTPEGMLKFAAKEINKYNESIDASKGLFGLKNKIPNLTAEQTKMILGEMGKIKNMPDGIQKAMAFKQLNDAIANLIPSPLFKKIVAVWKAGLLTGLKTTGLNTFSNLWHGVSEVVKDIPATAVDSVASLFTGKRTLAMTTKGTLSGIKEGFQKGWKYLKTGFDERNMGIKLDYNKVNFGNSKIAKGLQKYEETVFHLMGAEDQPFYYGAKARSLQSQAIAQAKNAKLKGTEAKKFIENLVSNPTDDMLKFSVSDAEIAVFQNETELGKAAKSFQRVGKGVGEIAVPFGRTPASVATQLINYSPVGVVKTIIQYAGKGKFNQRLFSQGIGRALTGTAIMYIGSELFKKGLINLSYPTSEREQKLWDAEGRTSNSFYDPITKKYRNLNIFGPAGSALIVGGYFQQSLQETGSPTQAIINAGVGGVKSLKEQTFLQGISSILDAINNPQGYATGVASNLISSLIPTIVGDVSNATDIKRKNVGLLDPLKAKIPGVRETLQPQVNVLGQERPQGGNFIETMLDPTRPSNVLDSPVISELRRITDAGFNVSPTQLGDKNGYKGLTPEENTAMWKKSGELINSKLNSLFGLTQYKNLTDEDKAQIITDIVEKAKTNARILSVMDMTENLSGQELKDKLSELKKSGIMTKEVFNGYLQLK